MKKILLITTIALFGLYVQPAYSVGIVDFVEQDQEYDGDDPILVNPDNKEKGDVCDPAVEDCSSDIINGSGGTDDSGDDTGGDTTTSEPETDPEPEPEPDPEPEPASEPDPEPEEDSTPFSCAVMRTCEQLGFTIQGAENCSGRTYLACPFDSNYVFCSLPENSAVSDASQCASDKEYVDGYCRPKCPDGSIRVGDTCKCENEHQVYSPYSNTCLCSLGWTGDGCQECEDGMTMITNLNGVEECIVTIENGEGIGDSDSDSGTDSDSTDSGSTGSYSSGGGCFCMDLMNAGGGGLIEGEEACAWMFDRDGHLMERYKNAAESCR